MANANTFIVDWDAKFHYNYWRPVTAIRNGDNDGNDGTKRDAGCTPLNTTPMHPEYPSQAAILAGAGTAALAAALGGAPSTPVNIVDSADPTHAQFRQRGGGRPNLGRHPHFAGGERPHGPGDRQAARRNDVPSGPLVRYLIAGPYLWDERDRWTKWTVHGNDSVLGSRWTDVASTQDAGSS